MPADLKLLMRGETNLKRGTGRQDMAEDDTIISHLAHRYTQSGMDKREKGAEETLGEKVAENFPKIVKGFKPQTQAY